MGGSLSVTLAIENGDASARFRNPCVQTAYTSFAFLLPSSERNYSLDVPQFNLKIKWDLKQKKGKWKSIINAKRWLVPFFAFLSVKGKGQERKLISSWSKYVGNLLQLSVGWREKQEGSKGGEKTISFQKQLPESVFYNHHSAFSICSDISRVKKHQHKIVGALYRPTNLGERIRVFYFFKRPEIPLRTLNKSYTFTGAQTHLLLSWCLWYLSKPSSSGHLGARNVLFVLLFFITQFSGISSITRAFNAFTVIAGLFPL